MSGMLTHRVLALLELSPSLLEQFGLPGTVLKVNALWQGPPLSREGLHEVCRLVWQTHQERLGVTARQPPVEPGVTFTVGPRREPVL
jgi:hypothetical protein